MTSQLFNLNVLLVVSLQIELTPGRIHRLRFFSRNTLTCLHRGHSEQGRYGHIPAPQITSPLIAVHRPLARSCRWM